MKWVEGSKQATKKKKRGGKENGDLKVIIDFKVKVNFCDWQCVLSSCFVRHGQHL